MAIQQAVLLIADIGGYTRFMSEHRFALAHAQLMVAELLEAVLDASKPLRLAKLEGDAAFLYAPTKHSRPAVERTVASIRAAFLKRRTELAENRLCDCKGCVEVDTLNLKFVAHVGEVAFQKVKRYTELAGVDVILVHRMLKNDVPVAEYVLMTDALLAGVGPDVARFARPLEHEFEGLGRTTTHYVDLAELARELPVVTRKPYLLRFLDRVVMTFKSLPYWLGLRRACADFQNVACDFAPALPPASGAVER